MRDYLQLYIATYWDGTAWLDLHGEPEPFKTASDIAFEALLSGRETTRLRPAQTGWLEVKDRRGEPHRG